MTEIHEEDTSLGLPKEMTRRTGVWVAAYIIAVIATCFVGYKLYAAVMGNGTSTAWAVALLLLWVAATFGSLAFIQIYTGPVPDNKNGAGEAPRSWFVFAYAFMVVALGLAIVPFTILTADEELGKQPISVLLGCVEGTDKSLPQELQCAKKGDAPRELWILNVGGAVQKKENCSNGCNLIRGGLAVPLYVVILALFGGAISLTRRVPEYQKRAAADYKQTQANEPKLELPVVREYLVFQIVQYISAPLIAVTAYYAIRPTDVPSSVALAFVSGFASESVLLMIRRTLEKITPSAPKVPGRGSVSVRVEKDGKAVDGAIVRIVGQPTLRAKVDNNKRYVFDLVPAGEHAIEVKFGAETKNVKVDVSDGQVATCEIKM